MVNGTFWSGGSAPLFIGRKRSVGAASRLVGRPRGWSADHHGGRLTKPMVGRPSPKSADRPMHRLTSPTLRMPSGSRFPWIHVLNMSGRPSNGPGAFWGGRPAMRSGQGRPTVIPAFQPFLGPCGGLPTLDSTWACSSTCIWPLGNFLG